MRAILAKSEKIEANSLKATPANKATDNKQKDSDLSIAKGGSTNL